MRAKPGFQSALERLEQESLLRRLHAMAEVGGKVSLDGRSFLNFSSNDYLDLANDARLKEGAKRAIDSFGCGATASRLMAGDLVLHEELEQRLAWFMRQESALVFPSGYQTNVSVLSSLVGRGDVVFSDALNHASIVDGCRLSGARICVYRHCDTAHLEALLAAESGSGRKLIVSDAIFSMDGDAAPVKALAELAGRYDAMLMVDEAHALGILGGGRGLCAERGVQPDVIVGTLTKSFGSGGGFVAGSTALRDYLINKARGFIFSTGIAPGCVGSALAACDIIESHADMGADLLARTDGLRAALQRQGVDVPNEPSPVIPIVIGSNDAAVDVSRRLLEEGLIVVAVRPPSVPDGTARLRLSVTLAHAESDLDRAADILAAHLLSAKV